MDLSTSDRGNGGTDTILEALELWKKRVIAAFLLISLLVAISAVLLFELGGVIKVWKVEFSDAETVQMPPKHDHPVTPAREENPQ